MVKNEQVDVYPRSQKKQDYFNKGGLKTEHVVEEYGENLPDIIPRKNPEYTKAPDNSKRENLDIKKLQSIFNDQNKTNQKQEINYFKKKNIYNFFLFDKKMDETVFNDQKNSLNNWFDYLTSTGCNYPSWFKSNTVNSVVNMGFYNKKSQKFLERDKETRAPFPDFNAQALSHTYDLISENNFSKFSEIYADSLNKIIPISKENKEKIEGEWIKFNQGSDSIILYKSLENNGTGWPIAGKKIAKDNLQNSDLYIYYTKDENNKNTIPRISIETTNGQVLKVSGIEKDQALETSLLKIAEDKCYHLPGGDKFNDKFADMYLLAKVEDKLKNNQKLDKLNLNFIYEIDKKTKHFGYKKDPRIEEIISTRDVKADLAFVFDCSPKQISNTTDEALRGGIKCHYGNLDLKEIDSINNTEFPEVILGDFYMRKVKLVGNGCKLPKVIKGNLDASGLESANNFDISKIKIERGIDLSGLTSTKYLTSPEMVNAHYKLGVSFIEQGFKMPKFIKGQATFNNLVSAKNFNIKETEFLDGLSMKSLVSDEYLEFGDNFQGNLQLNSLKLIDHLKKIPKGVTMINFSSLVSIKNLELYKDTKCCIFFYKLPISEKEILKKQYPNLKIIV